MRKGIIYLFFSALAIALSTVFAKLITANSALPAIEITFFRFLSGAVIITVYIVARGWSFQPNRFKYVILRSVFNTIAVLLFFMGVQFTTITNANMLNMTYPVFVFAIAPFINRERTPLRNYLYLVMSITGVYLIIAPDFGNINPGDIFAFLSGIVAGFAVSILREARKYDNSIVILFYLMVLGSIINFLIMVPFFILPEGVIIVYLLLYVIASLMGQFFITVGYRYIDAAPGSLISASRIVFAVLLGIIIFSDPLSWEIALGGLFIAISLAGVSRFHELVKNFTRESSNIKENFNVSGD
jgi:drug/metabolite transporter (DMT)-like permease